MIVLDTNALSEPLRRTPDPTVLTWVRSQSDVAVSTVTVAELLTGARQLLAGARRERLIVAMESILSGNRLLPFDLGSS